MSKDIILFDLETNGLKESDAVLSFSALLLDENDNVIKIYDRYYCLPPNHIPNPIAIGINKLTDKKITEKRKEQKAQYPRYFKDDKEIYSIFARAKKVIAHNSDFDTKFITYYHDFFFNDVEIFCTMKAVQYIYDAPYYKYGEPKFPKLKEALEHFNINTKHIKGEEHESLFDCYCTLEVYKALKKINLG